MTAVSSGFDVGAIRWTLTALAAAVLVACGGGGGSGVSAPSVVSGAVVKGPVAGATVCAYQLLPTGKGTELGCSTTNAEGSYSLSLNYTGPVIVEAMGGTYTDEASGAKNVSLSAALSVAGSVGPGTQTLVATPLTSIAMAHASAGGGLSLAGFEAASGEVAVTFGLPREMKIWETMPVVTGATNAYGDALIGFSKMLGAGASISATIVADFGSLASGFNFVKLPYYCAANETKQQLAESVPDSAAGGVYIGNNAGGTHAQFNAIDPDPVWRALLPASGAVMGCEIGMNTSGLVTLSCPASAFAAGPATLIAEGATIPVPSSLPEGGILIAARRIETAGSYAHPGATIHINAGISKIGEASTVAVGGGAIATPVTIAPASGGLCLSGSLTPSGGLAGGGSFFGGGASGFHYQQPVGPTPGGGGQIVISGANGGGTGTGGVIITTGNQGGTPVITVSPGANP